MLQPVNKTVVGVRSVKMTNSMETIVMNPVLRSFPTAKPVTANFAKRVCLALEKPVKKQMIVE